VAELDRTARSQRPAKATSQSDKAQGDTEVVNATERDATSRSVFSS